jgi:LytS/YehU family sensor histidine kinase
MFENKKIGILFHLLFWLVYIGSITLFFGEIVEIKWVFYRTLIAAFFNALLVYFNLYYLLPRYFEKKKYVKYILLLHLALAVITLLRAYTDSIIPLPRQNNLLHRYLFYPIHISSIIISGYMVLLLTMSLKFLKDYFINITLRNKLKYQQMEYKLQQLKNQINPHFLFNVLGNIYSLAYMKSDEAPVMISKLSDMMRYVLYDCQEKSVPLSKEIEYLHDFIDLHNLRKDNKMNITFEVEGNPDNHTIEPLLFLPLFENCFKHGNLEKIDEGWMKAKFTISDDFILLHIENTFDTGKIVYEETEEENEKKKKGGIGLSNIKERLNILYPGKHLFATYKNGNVFTVDLNINTNTK